LAATRATGGAAFRYFAPRLFVLVLCARLAGGQPLTSTLVL
jgi:hypothetical protein